MYVCLLLLLSTLLSLANQLESSYLHHLQTRIIDGSPVDHNEFPWYVILKKNASLDLLCGGSVIDQLWVLTSSRCVDGITVVDLVFGATKLNDPHAVKMTSNQIHMHPDYEDQKFHNDIALIKLPENLTFSDSIRPIQLVPEALSNRTFAFAQGTIMGYGVTDDFVEITDASPDLMRAYVHLILNVKCRQIFTDTDLITHKKVCGNGDDYSSMSICIGDLGGPLLTWNGHGGLMQIGINSFFVDRMCTQGYPSVFVRVGSYLDFIRNTTGLTFKQTESYID